MITEKEIELICNKYGNYERYMKGGKWQLRKVIHKRSYKKMITELYNFFKTNK